MMVDSSGPSLPRQCNTVGLQNLGDAEGWGDEGEGLYVFELKDGIYYRARIPDNTPINWLLDFDLRNPYVYTGGAKHRLTKWQNKGSALSALIPTRGRVELRRLPDAGYMVAARKSRTGGARLKLVSEDQNEAPTVPENSTIAFRLVTGSPPKSPLTLVMGVKINWDETAENAIVTVIVRTGGKPAERIYTSASGVRVNTSDNISLDEVYLHTPGIAHQKFLFCTSLPDISRIEAYLNA